MTKVNIKRRKSKCIYIGNVPVGNQNPITIQSMTKTDTRNVDKTVKQIKVLSLSGCEIIRCAVPDMIAANALKQIVKNSPIPVVADIHFDYKLAIKAVDSGIHALRINPGNIGSKARIKEVVNCANSNNVPIRIGVNAGSLEKDMLKKYNGPKAEALFESAKRHINILQDLNFDQIKVSIKASNVSDNVKALKMLAEMCDYPFHIGVTEAGPLLPGSIKSSVGLTWLLLEGLGDTVRVSLTSDPVEEVKTAALILKSLGLKKGGVDIISCPLCGRSTLSEKVLEISKDLYDKFSNRKEDIKIAVMGCEVNGPGEAKEADIGVAVSAGGGLLFKNGKKLKKVPEKDIENSLITLIEEFIYEKK